MADDTPANNGDELPELAYDEFSVMRLKEDEAVVSVHVVHGMNEEEWEQEAGGEDAVLHAEDHALFEALRKLWKYHRESGWDTKELMLDLEKDD